MTGGWARTRRAVLAARWPLAVVAAIVLVNLPALSHLVNVNPLGPIGVTARHVTRGLLPGLTAVDSDIGYTAQALGHRAALDWLHFHVPWWNPYEGVGSPLAAEMQSAAFFPPVLLMALTDGSLYFHVLMEVVAGLGTYLLVRELRLPAPVAAVGGVLFGLCGTFDWLWHAPMNPVPFLPLALLGVERSFRRPGGGGGWVLIAVALALSVYAGFPETAYFGLLLVVVWAAVRIVQSLTGSGAGRWRLAAHCGMGAGTGLLLSLPLALPFAQYFPTAYTGTHALGIGFQHLSGVHMAEMGLPYLYGPLVAFDSANHSLGTYWANAGGFLTAGVVVMAVAGLAGAFVRSAGGARRELGLRVTIAVTSVVVILWSCGVEPFSQLSHVIPYMSHVSVERYSSPVWEMSGVLLACFGLDMVGRDRQGLAAVAAGSSVALVLWAAELVGPPGSIAAATARVTHAAGTYATAMVAWAGGIALVLVGLAAGAALPDLLAARFTPRGGAGRLGARLCRAAVGVLLCVDAGAMALVPVLSAPRSVTLDLAPARYLAARLGLGRYYSFWVYHGNYGSYFGFASINTSDLPVPSPWAHEISTALAPNFEPIRFDGAVPIDPKGPSAVTEALTNIGAYEALDVRYFVAQDLSHPVFGDGPVYPYGMQRVFDDGFISIFALPDPLPYFRTVSGGPCSIGAAGRDSVTVDCSSPATLVRAELDMPGWTAGVNGRPVSIATYQGLLDAVPVAAGRSVVTFSYAPRHVDLALAGFGAGMVVLVGLPSLNRLRRRRRRRRVGPTASSG